MLIELRFENHRSIREEQALTMEAGSIGAKDDQRPRKVDGSPKPILPVAALYGANASGKTNVVAAARFLSFAVLNSHRLWPAGEGVPRDPFAWGDGPASPSLYEVTFLVDGVRHQYGFVANDDRFLEEWLYVWPRGRKQTWFVREMDGYKFGDHLKGENKLVSEVTRPNALFLSSAVQHRHEQLSKVFSWFQSRLQVSLGPRTGATQRLYSSLWLKGLAGDASIRGQQNLFESTRDGQVLLEAFRWLLKSADIGIEDLKLVDPSEADLDARPGRRPGRRQVMFKHTCSEDAWLPLEEESQGTITLFSLAPDLLLALEHGGVFIIDELEASLHPLLAVQLVQRFNDPKTNPKNAQLIFTTHDTNLIGRALGEPVLRRDQIWLTERNKQGATTLYPLTDYKPRKQENVERGYLQGRYGAIPFLGGMLQEWGED